jgi:hypothetical protein
MTENKELIRGKFRVNIENIQFLFLLNQRLCALCGFFVCNITDMWLYDGHRMARNCVNIYKRYRVSLHSFKLLDIYQPFAYMK